MRDGEVRSLPRPARHCHLSSRYNEAARTLGRDIPWVGWPPTPDDPDPTQGFVTDDGTFLARADAEAHARACGQLAGRLIGSVLTSEDLW